MGLQERTALVVLVPEAETLVKEFRERYDPSAAEGMPAHITVLYPFKPADEIDKDVVETLQHLFSCRSRFCFALEERKRFPTALYIAPRPDAPFKELTQGVTERYPETPPYGGAFSTAVPHLTIAQVANLQQLDRISAEFHQASTGRLPIHSYAEKVWLMERREGRWTPRISFPLDVAPGP